MAQRRDYRTGSIYRRKSDGLWMGTLEAGWTAKGTRRRITVSAKTEAEVKRKLRDKRLALERGQLGTGGRATVKAWAEEWLAMKVTELRPKAYNAAASAVNRWIIPTIGHKRLDTLTPGDLRAVADAQRKAGRKMATAAATHRTLLNMLRAGIVEGHPIPPRVLLVPAPKVAPSDRMDVTVEDALACLAVAGEIPHGIRWLFALLYGARQAESLGLVDESVDFDAGMIYLEWQLQALPYLDRKDKAKGFRVPDGFEARHLVDSWHLTRPKSKAGIRTLPMPPFIADALRAWLEVRPDNPWGLVFPTAKGRPANNKHDLEEWHALQGTACVGHPGGRYYHVHECRNLVSTGLFELGVDEGVITSLLGHSSIITSRRYQTVHAGPKLDAVEKLAARLQLGS